MDIYFSRIFYTHNKTTFSKHADYNLILEPAANSIQWVLYQEIYNDNLQPKWSAPILGSAHQINICMGEFLLTYTPIKDEQLQGPAVMRYLDRGGGGASIILSLHPTLSDCQMENLSQMERSSKNEHSTGLFKVWCWSHIQIFHWSVSAVVVESDVETRAGSVLPMQDMLVSQLSTLSFSLSLPLSLILFLSLFCPWVLPMLDSFEILNLMANVSKAQVVKGSHFFN